MRCRPVESFARPLFIDIVPDRVGIHLGDDRGRGGRKRLDHRAPIGILADQIDWRPVGSPEPSLRSMPGRCSPDQRHQHAFGGLVLHPFQSVNARYDFDDLEIHRREGNWGSVVILYNGLSYVNRDPFNPRTVVLVHDTVRGP